MTNPEVVSVGPVSSEEVPPGEQITLSRAPAEKTMFTDFLNDAAAIDRRTRGLSNSASNSSYMSMSSFHPASRSSHSTKSFESFGSHDVPTTDAPQIQDLNLPANDVVGDYRLESLLELEPLPSVTDGTRINFLNQRIEVQPPEGFEQISHLVPYGLIQYPFTQLHLENARDERSREIINAQYNQEEGAEDQFILKTLTVIPPEKIRKSTDDMKDYLYMLSNAVHYDVRTLAQIEEQAKEKYGTKRFYMGDTYTIADYREMEDGNLHKITGSEYDYRPLYQLEGYVEYLNSDIPYTDLVRAQESMLSRQKHQ